MDFARGQGAHSRGAGAALISGVPTLAVGAGLVWLGCKLVGAIAAYDEVLESD